MLVTRRGKPTFRAAMSKLVLVALFVTAAACSGDSPTGPTGNNPKVPSGNDPAAGSFTLTTVNALTLPFTFFNESGYVLQMTASTMALESGGQFILAMTTRETVAGFPSTFVDTVRGTWSQNVGAITLTQTGGAAKSGTWNGVTLSFPYEGETGTLALVYTRNQ
jgi:hypothetical protein